MAVSNASLEALSWHARFLGEAPGCRLAPPPPRPAAHRQASSITRARKNLRNRNKTGDTRARRRAAGALSGRSPSLYPPPRTQNTPSTSLACSAEAGTSSTEPAGGCAVSQGPPGGVRGAGRARTRSRRRGSRSTRARRKTSRARANTRRTSTRTVATSPVHARGKDKFGPLSVRVA